MLVERMLPPSLADYADQSQFPRMHVRVAVVGLMRILRRVVGGYVVGHRATADEEMGGLIGLGRELSWRWAIQPASSGHARRDMREPRERRGARSVAHHAGVAR